MKSLIVAFLLVGLLSCNSETRNNPETSNASSQKPITPDFSVALSFINDYTKFCTKADQRSNTEEWIKQDSLLTSNFKDQFRNLLDSAKKKDPELGLDFDPIFDAQDFPEKGFTILKADTLGQYVTVVGNDWKEFELVLKVKQEHDKWLVDGAGVINIPNDKRAKR